METRPTVPNGGTATLPSVSTPRYSTPRHTEAALEKPLTHGEKTTLKSLETVIQQGMKTFLEVGNALLRIRDERLYRGTHGAFEAYCRERWQISKTQANRFIAASSVAKNLAPIGVIPTSESQVRLLSSLKPAQQVKVFERAAKVAGGVDKVTAQTITKAATDLKYRTPAQASAASAPNDTVSRKAALGAIRDWADDNWEKASHLSVAEFVKQIKKVLDEV